jgi:hypothetical protein
MVQLALNEADDQPVAANRFDRAAMLRSHTSAPPG